MRKRGRHAHRRDGSPPPSPPNPLTGGSRHEAAPGRHRVRSRRAVCVPGPGKAALLPVFPAPLRADQRAAAPRSSGESSRAERRRGKKTVPVCRRDPPGRAAARRATSRQEEVRRFARCRRGPCAYSRVRLRASQRRRLSSTTISLRRFSSAMISSRRLSDQAMISSAVSKSSRLSGMGLYFRIASGERIGQPRGSASIQSAVVSATTYVFLPSRFM